MKKYLFITLITLFAFSVFSQEYIFKFKIDSRDEIKKLTNIISIDNYKNGEIIAYANQKEFDYFISLGYKYELLPHPSLGKALTMATTVAEMADWDRYPTYDVYIEMMHKFASDYPTLCQVENIGTSVDGRALLALKISDNVTQHEAEPEFFYTSSMHGDETTGFVLLLRLADWLLSNYGTNSEASYIVDNFELYINPAANPDGTYTNDNNTITGATRSNANYIDINRNFSDPRAGEHPDGNVWQAETQAMMNFAEEHHFVMSANFHGGIELANYPWDTWTSSTNKHADDNWWYKVSQNYADTCQSNSPTGYFDDYGGVTNGGDWYVISGGRQDYMNYFNHCREVTLEISSTKSPSAETLPDYWNYNKQAILDYIKETEYGFNGTVKNTNGDPLDAKIEITAHDKDNSWVITDPENGDYYRPIEPGTYNVTYSAFGYSAQTHSMNVTDWKTTTIKNIVLEVAPDTHTISGIVTEDGTSSPIENVKIEILETATNPVYTIVDGTYLKYAMEDGTYQLEASKDGLVPSIQTVNISGNDKILNFTLKSNVNITKVDNKNIKIYPNPNSGHFYIKSNEHVSAIKIIDITGKIISDLNVNNNSVIIENIKQGLYILKIHTENEIIYKKVVVK